MNKRKFELIIIGIALVVIIINRILLLKKDYFGVRNCKNRNC